MKYTIICNGYNEMQAVIKKANLLQPSTDLLFKSCKIRAQLIEKKPCLLTCNDKGEVVGWDYANGGNIYTMLSLNNEFWENEIIVYIFASNILNNSYKAPWVYIESEKTPPKGYRFLMDDEKNTTYREDSAKYWDTFRYAWRDVAPCINPKEMWGQFNIYCIPESLELRKLETILTMDQIADMFGVPVESLKIIK